MNSILLHLLEINTTTLKILTTIDRANPNPTLSSHHHSSNNNTTIHRHISNPDLINHCFPKNKIHHNNLENLNLSHNLPVIGMINSKTLVQIILPRNYVSLVSHETNHYACDVSKADNSCMKKLSAMNLVSGRSLSISQNRRDNCSYAMSCLT